MRFSFPVIASFALASVAPFVGSTPASAEPAREGVAQVCSGFSSDVLAAPSLSAPIDVLSVEPIHRRMGRVQTGTVVGARMHVVADPGISASGVQRLIRCRAASGSATDPLAVPGATYTVSEHATGFVIEVRGARSATSQEIWSRASALTTR